MGSGNFALAGQNISATVDRRRKIFNANRVKGRIHVQILRANGVLEDIGQFANGVTNEGFNDFLDAYFNQASQNTNYYLGLISNSGYTGVAVTDTMASHSGWVEQHANYSESNRPEWNPGAAASKQVTNSTTVDFSITVDSTVVKGIFVTTNNTKNGTTGKLWATALFNADQTLFNGDTLKITYTVLLS